VLQHDTPTLSPVNNDRQHDKASCRLSFLMADVTDHHISPWCWQSIPTTNDVSRQCSPMCRGLNNQQCQRTKRNTKHWTQPISWPTFFLHTTQEPWWKQWCYAISPSPVPINLYNDDDIYISFNYMLLVVY